jgi:hypothetical protein
MEIEPRTSSSDIRIVLILLGIAGLLVLGLTILFQVVLVDRLTIHNATTRSIVFPGTDDPDGHGTVVDVYVDACASEQFEWGFLGWAPTDRGAFNPVADAVPVTIEIEPPFDGIAGAHYVAVVTADGVREIANTEAIPPCAG